MLGETVWVAWLLLLVVFTVALCWLVYEITVSEIGDIRRTRAAAYGVHRTVERLRSLSHQLTAVSGEVEQLPARPVRVQRSVLAGWVTPEGAVRVEQGTRWSNPWKVGDRVPLPDLGGCVRVTPQLAVDLFAAWFEEAGLLDDAVADLGGMDLVCWCKLGEPCHADWLLDRVAGRVEVLRNLSLLDTRQQWL